MHTPHQKESSVLFKTLKSIANLNEAACVWVTDSVGILLVSSSEAKNNFTPDFEQILRKHKSKIEFAFPGNCRLELEESFALQAASPVLISATQFKLQDQTFYAFTHLNHSNELVHSPQRLIAEEFGIYSWQFHLHQNTFYFPKAAAQRVFGSSKEEVDYNDFYTALSAESLQQFVKAMEAAINFGKGFKLELMLDVPGGYKWISFSCTATRDSFNSPWLTGLLRDLTEEKATVEKTEKLDLWLNAGLCRFDVSAPDGTTLAAWGSAHENPHSKVESGKRTTTLFDFRNNPKYLISADLGQAAAFAEAPNELVSSAEPASESTVQLFDTLVEIPITLDNRNERCIALSQWLGQSLDTFVCAVGIYARGSFEWKAWWKSPVRFMLSAAKAGEWQPATAWLEEVKADLGTGAEPVWWPQDLLPYALEDNHGTGWMLLPELISSTEMILFAFQSHDPQSLREKKKHVLKALSILKETPEDPEKHIKKLQAQLAEKELLLKELNHRAKNNISIASSLVKMQAAYAGDDQALQVLKQTQKRLEVISGLHELMYQGPFTTGRVDMKAYLTRLINGLVEGFGSDGLTLELNLDFVEFDSRQANTVGMLVNELVSNAFKYALNTVSQPVLKVDFLVKGELIKLRVSDNGPGIKPENMDNESLGKILVQEFVTQLKGTMEVLTASGTTYLITFKK